MNIILNNLIIFIKKELYLLYLKFFFYFVYILFEKIILIIVSYKDVF